MITVRRALATLAVAVAHYVVTAVCAVVSTALRMGAIDGARRAGTADAVWAGLLKVLMSPLVTLWTHLAPKRWDQGAEVGHLVLFANSLLWGAAIVWLVLRRRARRASAA